MGVPAFENPKKDFIHSAGEERGKQELGSLVEHPLQVRQASRDGDTKVNTAEKICPFVSHILVEETGCKPKDR